MKKSKWRQEALEAVRYKNIWRETKVIRKKKEQEEQEEWKKHLEVYRDLLPCHKHTGQEIWENSKAVGRGKRRTEEIEI